MLLLLLALLLDRLVGDPSWLWSRLPHPVVVFGTGISFFDRLLNRPFLADGLRRVLGAISISALLLISACAGAVLHHVFVALGPFGFALEVVVTAVFLAQKSLLDHVRAVATGLRMEGLAGGRKAVAMIVGRDPTTLNEAGVTRAALESLSENFADGVVAPAFWYAVLGLPGLLAYKMLNTADSMIGHKSETYLHFGWAAARLDDLANWPAARLSGLLIVGGAWVCGGCVAARRCFSVMMRDHDLHRSPNSGWPEAAAAGALDVALAGPRVYAGQKVSEPMMNAAGRRAIGASDIVVGLALIDRAWLLGLICVFMVFSGFAILCQ
ncbi:adenosylcobinamide-phosphate synthase [Agrobacterium vitis]|nr:adenosylcobinamide-phosphate synthase [Agrobacterium vitis]MBE1438774.1 adenosylcobinamide-phosphate synthase [Agrobacterium vitis]